MNQYLNKDLNKVFLDPLNREVKIILFDISILKSWENLDSDHIKVEIEEYL